MEICIIYNLAKDLKKGVESDLICEQEIEIILPLVAALLQERGHDVSTLETSYDLWEELKKKKEQIDLFFNLAEAFGGGNDFEPLVPAMLEALEVSFTGASSHNMMLTLDKEKSKLVVAAYGLPVPPYQMFRTGDEAISAHLTFPLIVKPVRQEGSIGIYHDSVVKDEVELREKVKHILKAYRQPALVEQFITGREISVGVIGNGGNLRTFPPLEFLFEESESELNKIRSFEYKWGGKKEVMVKADLPDELVEKLTDYAKIAFISTECQDYARMDFRLTPNGDIFLIEVNYNPGIGPNTHGLNNTLTMMASFAGLTFEDLIEEIVLLSAKRQTQT